MGTDGNWAGRVELERKSVQLACVNLREMSSLLRFSREIRHVTRLWRMIGLKELRTSMT